MKMKSFEQTWRWYGSTDPVTLADIRQAGATGIVSSLYHIKSGEIWSIEEIKKHQAEIEAAGLKWTVVESLPIHEDIKRQSGNWESFIENYKISLQNLAASGIHIVAYNFMPVLDWSRTDLFYELPNGAKALRFDIVAFAAFDIFILKRPNAEADYSPKIIQLARERTNQMSEPEKASLTKNIIAGLPGGTTDKVRDLDEFLEILESYSDISPVKLKDHLIHFLEEIIPVADSVNIKMALHPDDPPFSLLGLPRIVSKANDLAYIFDKVSSKNNGLCFCTGSLGVDPNNDLAQMVDTFAERIHFVHLRSTKRDEQGNFHEADHLDGDVDMYAVIHKLLQAGGKQNKHIPMRPDHGHQMLDDLGKHVNPGYSAIGRLKGLAEIRGLEMGIIRSNQNAI